MSEAAAHMYAWIMSQSVCIYFYCFNHIIGGVGMWSAKCVSKYSGGFGQSRFEISDFVMFPQKTDE